MCRICRTTVEHSALNLRLRAAVAAMKRPLDPQNRVYAGVILDPRLGPD